jgi:hypothetical protein
MKTCAAEAGNFISVEERFELPDFADQAAVFLNGWSLEYLEGDQHVMHVAAAIRSSRLQDRTLFWEAFANLSDDGNDDAYEACFYTTVVAWDSTLIRCTADHQVIMNYTRSADTTQYPIVSSSSFARRGGAFPPRSSVVLPCGFHFEYWDDDRHLQHIAYNLAQSENSVTSRQPSDDPRYGILPQPSLDGATDRVGDGFVSWDTQGILQDSSYRDFWFWNFASVISGSGVGVVQPPFTILPSRRELNLASFYADEQTHDMTFDGLGFEVAVPMLTGWDLKYDFDDEHVKKVGVWLDNFEYEKPTDGTNGRLRLTVTSVLRDNDITPGYQFKHNVNVLGFRRSQPVPST